jgi:hypothetical protein
MRGSVARLLVTWRSVARLVTTLALTCRILTFVYDQGSLFPNAFDKAAAYHLYLSGVNIHYLLAFA